jgi:hypothetical protein
MLCCCSRAKSLGAANLPLINHLSGLSLSVPKRTSTTAVHHQRGIPVNVRRRLRCPHLLPLAARNVPDITPPAPSEARKEAARCGAELCLSCAGCRRGKNRGGETRTRPLPLPAAHALSPHSPPPQISPPLFQPPHIPRRAPPSPARPQPPPSGARSARLLYLSVGRDPRVGEEAGVGRK